MDNKNTLRILLALVIIIAFFLPWFKSGESALNILMAKTYQEETAVTVFRYSFILIPLFALIILIRSVSKKSLNFFLRLLPFLITAILTAWVILGVKYMGGTTEDFKGLFQTLAYGYFITAVSSFLLIFI